MELGLNQSLTLGDHAILSREFEVQTVITSVALTPQAVELEWPTVNLLIYSDVSFYYNFGLNSVADGGDVSTTNDLICPATTITEIKVPWGAINQAGHPRLIGNTAAPSTKLYFVVESTAGTAKIRIVKQ